MKVSRGPAKPKTPQQAPAPRKLRVGRAPAGIRDSGQPTDFEVLAALGIDSRTWRCRYGCVGSVAPSGAVYHHYNCPYWAREGKAETPF